MKYFPFIDVIFNNVVNRNRIIYRYYHYFQQLYIMKTSRLRFRSTESITADLRCFSFYNYFRQSHGSQIDGQLFKTIFSAYFVNIYLLKLINIIKFVVFYIILKCRLQFELCDQYNNRNIVLNLRIIIAAV